MQKIHIILLSGGSGTRLWPLSNNARSKQFLKVLRDDQGNHISMVQRVFAQIQQVQQAAASQGTELDITIATSESQAQSIEAQLPPGTYNLVQEPTRRDTAPAIMLACEYLTKNTDAAAADTVVVMPIDTFADQAYYNKIIALNQAVQAQNNDLTLLGVTPTYPSEKYGYIIPANNGEGEGGEGDGTEKPNEKTNDKTTAPCHSARSATSRAESQNPVGTQPPATNPCHSDSLCDRPHNESEHCRNSQGVTTQKVSAFKEKPTQQQAEQYITQGALWNCGVFAFKLGYLTNITASYTAANSFQELLKHYADLPKNSFDYEVVEKAKNIAVIPYSGTWCDLGTWNTLCDQMQDQTAGRVAGANTCQNTHVINELNLPLVTLGLKDAVVVATHDGILVADKSQSAAMKPFVNEVAATRPMYEQRRWGEYRVLDAGVSPNGTKSLTKELVIKAGKQLSYQTHNKRSEVWTVIDGEGEVVQNDQVQKVKVGSVVNIQPKTLHAARAIKNLHIIEVQLGTDLIEEDIIRHGNFWND